MTLLSFSVHHLDHGIAALEAVSPAAPFIAQRLGDLPEIRGVILLATCNRFELYLDADPTDGCLEAIVGEELSRCINQSGIPCDTQPIPLHARGEHSTIHHIFRVAAGLDSMVIGEREIAGQLRRALNTATAEGTSTLLLSTVVQHALRCSRKVSTTTTLADHGRSVVSVGLDLAQAGCPASTRVLLIGTGSYAGATVQALRRRSYRSIEVYSRSGRAPEFAASHDLDAATDLTTALEKADLVVCCSGTGEPALTTTLVESAIQHRNGISIVDLALRHDVEPAVGSLPGVRLFGLADISKRVGNMTNDQLRAAEQIVDDGIAELTAALLGRQLDPAVVALRDLVSDMVDDEISRLPTGTINANDAAHALRRLAARLIHVPLVRARKAAEQGRGDDYLGALNELFDVEVSPSAPLLERDACPATGLRLADLDRVPEVDLR